MSTKQDAWLQAALQGLDTDLGGAIGPLSEQDIQTTKAMLLATLRASVSADPAGFRQSLDANAQAAAAMLGATETAAPAETPAPAAVPAADVSASSATSSSGGAAAPIRNLRASLASGKSSSKSKSAGKSAAPADKDF